MSDYQQLLDKYNDLRTKYLQIASIRGMARSLEKDIEKQIQTTEFMRSENIVVEAPFWLENVIELGKIIEQLKQLYIVNDKEAPFISTYKSPDKSASDLTNKSNDRHVHNMDQIVTYKCGKNKRLIKQFKQIIVDSWTVMEGPLVDVDTPIIGANDTSILQDIVHANDADWRRFVSECDYLSRRRIFSSERQGRYIRDFQKIYFCESFLHPLQRGKGSGKNRSNLSISRKDEILDYLCYFMDDREALGSCIDADINQNKFCTPAILGNERTIKAQYAGDKQMKYGYAESCVSLTRMESPMSAKRSIATMLICGDFADERKSHLSVIQKIKNKYGYDKQYIMCGLTYWPVVLSTIIYCLADDNTQRIQSRMATSAIVIWDEKVKKDTGSRLGTYNEEIHTTIDKEIIRLQDNIFESREYTTKKKRKKKISNSQDNVDDIRWKKCEGIKLYAIIYLHNLSFTIPYTYI